MSEYFLFTIVFRENHFLVLFNEVESHLKYLFAVLFNHLSLESLKLSLSFSSRNATNICARTVKLFFTILLRMSLTMNLLQVLLRDMHNCLARIIWIVHNCFVSETIRLLFCNNCCFFIILFNVLIQLVYVCLVLVIKELLHLNLLILLFKGVLS